MGLSRLVDIHVIVRIVGLVSTSNSLHSLRNGRVQRDRRCREGRGQVRCLARSARGIYRGLTAMTTLSLMMSAHWPSSLHVSPAAGARGTVASSCRSVTMVGSVLDMGGAKLKEAKVEAVVVFVDHLGVTGTTVGTAVAITTSSISPSSKRCSSPRACSPRSLSPLFNSKVFGRCSGASLAWMHAMHVPPVSFQIRPLRMPRMLQMAEALRTWTTASLARFCRPACPGSAVLRGDATATKRDDA